jgi:hypothetical protein
MAVLAAAEVQELLVKTGSVVRTVDTEVLDFSHRYQVLLLTMQAAAAVVH